MTVDVQITSLMKRRIHIPELLLRAGAPVRWVDTSPFSGGHSGIGTVAGSLPAAVIECITDE
ncbi:MAG: hypothetical protein ACI9HI_001722 [Salinirussus sp.]|jgi:hypothetical protein